MSERNFTTLYAPSGQAWECPNAAVESWVARGFTTDAPDPAYVAPVIEPPVVFLDDSQNPQPPGPQSSGSSAGSTHHKER